MRLVLSTLLRAEDETVSKVIEHGKGPRLVLTFFTPTGFRNKARGCEFTRYPGSTSSKVFNFEEVVHSSIVPSGGSRDATTELERQPWN